MTPQQIQLYIKKCAEKGVPNHITLNVLLKEAGIKELPIYLEKRSGWVAPTWEAIKQIGKFLIAKPQIAGQAARISYPKVVGLALTPPLVAGGWSAAKDVGDMVSGMAQKLTPNIKSEAVIAPKTNPTAQNTETEFDPLGVAGASVGGLLGLGVGPLLFGSADPIGARLLGAASGTITGALAGNLVKNLVGTK